MLDEGGDPGSLLWEEPGYCGVRLGSGEVDLLVCGVEVAADDDVAMVVSPGVDVLEEGVVEPHLVGEAICVFLAVGKIDVEQGEPGVLGDEDAAFCVELVDAEARLDGERLVCADGCDAAVAFAFRWAPVAVVAGEVPQ